MAEKASSDATPSAVSAVPEDEQETAAQSSESEPPLAEPEIHDNVENTSAKEQRETATVAGEDNPKVANTTEMNTPKAAEPPTSATPLLATQKKPKRPFSHWLRLATCILGIILGIMISLGSSVFRETTVNAGSTYVSDVSFGADYYTEQYAATRSTVIELNEIAEAYSNGATKTLEACALVANAIGLVTTIYFIKSALDVIAEPKVGA